ncbi:MAG: holo-ACP synthase [Bacteroidota bacterium]|nr:holo-ACP synthase [Bacteroidota bacterium]
MITGIGVDLIETARVAEKISKDSGFREYVFSENEISYCESKTNKTEHYAARFAAKEALLKALGTGFPGGLLLNEIDITSDDSGKPGFKFHGNSAVAIASFSIGSIHLTLSHLKDIACAMVVIEK